MSTTAKVSPAKGAHARTAPFCAFQSAVLDLVRNNQEDLPMRQLAVLMTCGEMHGVRELSAHLGVGKPAITRASQALVLKGYATKDRDPANQRNVIIAPTSKGETLKRRIAVVLNRSFGEGAAA